MIQQLIKWMQMISIVANHSVRSICTIWIWWDLSSKFQDLLDGTPKLFTGSDMNSEFDFSIFCEFFKKSEKVLFVYFLLLLLFYQNNLINSLKIVETKFRIRCRIQRTAFNHLPIEALDLLSTILLNNGSTKDHKL